MAALIGPLSQMHCVSVGAHVVWLVRAFWKHLAWYCQYHSLTVKIMEEFELTAHGGSILMTSCASIGCTMLLNAVSPRMNTLFHHILSTEKDLEK
jgi:hypothetical protein